MLERVRSTPLAKREEADTKEGIALGVHAVNPVNGERIPVLRRSYVLMEYGTGADHGRAGARPARLRVRPRHGLPIRVVIQPEGEERGSGR